MTYESYRKSSKRRSLIILALSAAAMSLGVLLPSQSAQADAFGTFQLTSRTSPTVADSPVYMQDLYSVEAGVDVLIPGYDLTDENNLFSFSGADDGSINSGSLISIEVVPEPTSLALVACSVGLLARRRPPRSA